MVGTAGSPDWSCSKELGENGSEQRVAGRGVTEALGVEETPVGANVRTKARRADKLQAGICPLEHVSEGTHHHVLSFPRCESRDHASHARLRSHRCDETHEAGPRERVDCLKLR